ncbi:MAG: calcium/sodium antiporter [Thermoguttaceae bacterium]|nr:calcium/sodium antiporter [Thermoguttaceae bacterium]
MPTLDVFRNLGLAALGVALLYYGADFLVRGGVSLAVKARVSRLVIGLTLAAFATSSPELVVSIDSALSGSADISLGNVIGSNICNVALILGLCALLRPMPFHANLKRFDLPVMMFATLALTGFYFLNHGINRWEGAFFCACILTYTTLNVMLSKKQEAKKAAGSGGNEANDEADGEAGSGLDPEVSESMDKPLGVPLAVLAVVGGVVMLVLGAKSFLTSAVAFADALGISKAVTGLTIVAVGTSLPELATSFVAALKGENDIAVGNIVGSNIFNVFCILGIVPVISPLTGQSIRGLDFAVMLGVCGALFLFGMFGKRLNRVQGALLLTAYIAYTAYLVIYHT